MKKSEEMRRSSFSPADIDIIYSCKNYPTMEDGARFWLPLLGLFTGVRLNELGQLARNDVILTGIPAIRISDQSDVISIRKSLKNINSRRVIPIHKRLIELGFLNFAAAGNSDHLFSELPHNGPYEPTKAFSQWFGRYLRRVGIAETGKVFHSLRHTFKDECRRAGIGEEVHDALTGHAGLNRSVGRSYGTGVPLEILASAMDRIHSETLIGIQYK